MQTSLLKFFGKNAAAAHPVERRGGLGDEGGAKQPRSLQNNNPVNTSGCLLGGEGRLFLRHGEGGRKRSADDALGPVERREKLKAALCAGETKEQKALR